MGNSHRGGNIANSITQEEHRSVNGVDAKAVVPYSFDGTNLIPMQGNLVPDSYDYISAAYPDTVTEIYTYKLGGSGGTTKRTVTVVYTDSTKASISSVTRS